MKNAADRMVVKTGIRRTIVKRFSMGSVVQSPGEDYLKLVPVPDWYTYRKV